MLVDGKHYKTVWFDKGVVKMINQPGLPHKFEIYECKNHKETSHAISTMVVRGAGAIGVTGGYAMAQVVLEAPEEGFADYIEKGYQTIKSTRPTAQNLFHSLNFVYDAIKGTLNNVFEARKKALIAADNLAETDMNACKRIGELGSVLIKNNFKILTHCNAGWLAFTDWGSALSPIYQAKREGKKVFVWVDETRPRLQGASLTAWELMREQIDCSIIADNASGYYMSKGEVDMVIVGSDRIAQNGDVANKIGTYEKAVLAWQHNIPFYVAAPLATVDWDCQSGKDIPIEERSQDEVLIISGKDKKGEICQVSIAPDNARARNPAFDVTPAKFITAIITEKGIVKPDKLNSLK